MPVPEFLWGESSAGLVEDSEPTVDTVRFGDGYTQRSAAGINSLARVWDLSFEAVDNAIADDIVAYWRERGGWQRFEWTPRWATDPVVVICPRWSRKPDGDGLSLLTARFQEVFEP